MRFKLLVIILLISLFSCTSENLVEVSIGSNKLFIEIASTDIERQVGLMNRESLGDDMGMLFIFDKEQSVSFWMKNTLIPLSIAYINKYGKILEIYDMKPQSLEPVPSKRSSVLYALEVNKGYFDSKGIKVGDTLELSNVKSYLNSSK